MNATGAPISPSTVNLYRWSAARIVDQHGTVKLADLTVRDVELMLDWLAKRKAHPLSASSLRKVRGTLQRAVDFGRPPR